MDGFPADAKAERTRGRWPSGLIAMLALVGLIELTISKSGDRLQTPAFAGYRFLGRAIKTKAPRSAEVLVVGDSLLKFGVVPRILEEATGSKAYNLALIGGQPPDTYFTLRQALNRGARPSSIVVDFKANMLAVDPKLQPNERAELYSLADCLDMGWSSGDASFGSSLLLAKILPSFKYRNPLRGELVASLKNTHWPGHGDAATSRRNWDVNLGANVAPTNPAAKDIPEHWDEKAYLLPTFSSHPVNTRYIERTLELASSYKIPVYWVIPPILPRVQARREQMGVDAAFVAYVRSFQAKSPGLTVVDGRHSGYEAPLFVDAAHLDRVGASAFTVAVAEILQKGQSGPKWVDLPVYREPKPRPALEDMNQSRVALSRDASAGRVLR